MFEYYIQSVYLIIKKKKKKNVVFLLFIHMSVILSIIYIFVLISALGHCTNYILERSVQKARVIGTRFSTQLKKKVSLGPRGHGSCSCL